MVSGAISAHADGHHHRNEIAREQQIDEIDVDALEITDEAQIWCVITSGVRRKRHRARMNEAPVLPAKTDRPATMLVDESGELLIELA